MDRELFSPGRAAASAVLVLLLASLAAGQPPPGAVLVAGADNLTDGHIKVVDRAGKTSLLARIRGAFPLTVDMDTDNANVLAALGVPPYGLARIAPGGQLTSVMTLGELVSEMSADQTGTFVAFASGDPSHLLRVDPATPAVATLLTRTGVHPAGTVDLDTGEVVFCRRSPLPNTVFGYDPRSAAVTTLLGDLGAVPTAMAGDPESGAWLVATTGPAGAILAVTRSGGRATLIVAPFARSVRVDRDGTYYVLQSQGPFGTLTHYDRAARPLQTVPLLALQGVTEIEIYAARPLFGRGAARPGSAYTLDIRAGAASAGKRYFLLASLAPRPPIQAPSGEKLYLDLDALFMMTALDRIPFFKNFQGVLDGRGQAAGQVQVPPGVTGARVFFAGFVLDPAQPGAIGRVFNTVGVTFE